MKQNEYNGERDVVYAGIDTHADTHHVAVIDGHGRALDDVQVRADAAGYRRAIAFLSRWPRIAAVGVECTGSYGAAITRALLATGLRVVEVNRPNRFDRRSKGKTDTFDAYSAAEAVLTGRAHAAPKGADGLVEALRALRTTRSSALRERTATINQIKAMLIAGPERLRRDTETCRTLGSPRRWPSPVPLPNQSPPRKRPPTRCVSWPGATGCSPSRSMTCPRTCGACSRTTPAP